MPEFCKVERDARLLIVTMNRPEVMNSLHPPANAELEKVFDDFVADPDLWVAILTGAGERAFSAGNDLKYTASSGGKVEIGHLGFIAPRVRLGPHGLQRDLLRPTRGVARAVMPPLRIGRLEVANGVVEMQPDSGAVVRVSAGGAE